LPVLNVSVPFIYLLYIGEGFGSSKNSFNFNSFGGTTFLMELKPFHKWAKTRGARTSLAPYAAAHHCTEHLKPISSVYYEKAYN
jgi:hypothetical protein